ncbi:MAG: glycosyltransferase family 4 protein [Bacteroidales bacterium]|nr:glycosyltransferase family 4 protein [Bacteroidales bacterium]
MKILQIANKVPYPPKDGGSIATFAMTRGFRALGHEVVVLAMSTTKHPVKQEDIPEEIQNDIRFILVDVDTRLSPIRAIKNLLFSSMPYNAERFITREFSRQLEALLRNEHFDVIQLEGLYLAPYVPLIREHSKAVVSMRAHNIEHEIWQRTVKQRSGFARLYTSLIARRVRKMELKCMNTFDAIVPITSRDDKILKSLGCHLPSHVSPTGIDMEGFLKYNGKPAFPSLFHIGALDWSPNQEGIDWFLKKCWPGLHASHPGLQFYIAGRNAPDHIKNIKAPNVIFKGEVDNAYVFMEDKAIMIVPLLSGSGMRIKIIEGMALGKSIVSTSIGAEGISVTSGTDIIIADDHEKFTEGIESLLNNFDKFEAIGRNARKFVEKNYDNLSITKALTGFYNELI